MISTQSQLVLLVVVFQGGTVRQRMLTLKEPMDQGALSQVASKFNPLTYLVNAERALFSGDVGSAAALWGWVAALVTVAVGLTVGIRSMRSSAD